MRRNKLFLAISLLIASTTAAEATDYFYIDSQNGFETTDADASPYRHFERRSSRRNMWQRMLGWNRGGRTSRSNYIVRPDADSDTATTTVDTPTTIDLLANDTGTGLKLKSVYQNTAFGGTTTTNESVITYTPPAGFTGTDEFWYEVVDNNGQTNSARVTVEVSGVSTTAEVIDTGIDTETTQAVFTDPTITDPTIADPIITDPTTFTEEAVTETTFNEGLVTDAVIGEPTPTLGVKCDYSESAFNSSESVAAVATAEWSCGTERVLTANGLPDHEIGTFPSEANENTVAEQTVAETFTLSPAKTETMSTPEVIGYALNGVKFDAVTTGSCNFTGDDCSLTDNTGIWSIEAIGQTSFDFGSDDNNGYVQADGAYRYHGMPEGLLSNQGASDAVMTLIGWAADGFPIYGRHGHTVADDVDSGLSVMTSSYQQIDDTEGARPLIDTYPLGTFTQDWQYVAGSGDLDECNGRTGVTPEFPEGIYHYFATDSYPYIQRCVKGVIEDDSTVEEVVDTTILTIPNEIDTPDETVDDAVVVPEEATAQDTDVLTEESAMAIAAEAAAAIAAEAENN